MVTPIKVIKHDKYVLELKDRIEQRYDSLSLHVKVKKKKRSLGEIDILAKKGNIMENTNN